MMAGNTGGGDGGADGLVALQPETHTDVFPMFDVNLKPFPHLILCKYHGIIF